MVTKVTKVTRFFQDKLKEILFFCGNLLIYNIIHISQTKIPAGGGGERADVCSSPNTANQLQKILIFSVGFPEYFCK